MNKAFAMKLLTDGAQAHKEMWTWLSENDSAVSRKDWPGQVNWVFVSGLAYISCFACDADNVILNAVPDRCSCDSCPLLKASSTSKYATNKAACISGVHTAWLHAETPEVRKAVALEIANFEWFVSEEDVKAVIEFFNQKEV